jgi:hypothetical protein
MAAVAATYLVCRGRCRGADVHPLVHELLGVILKRKKGLDGIGGGQRK